MLSVLLAVIAVGMGLDHVVMYLIFFGLLGLLIGMPIWRLIQRKRASTSGNHRGFDTRPGAWQQRSELIYIKGDAGATEYVRNIRGDIPGLRPTIEGGTSSNHPKPCQPIG